MGFEKSYVREWRYMLEKVNKSSWCLHFIYDWAKTVWQHYDSTMPWGSLRWWLQDEPHTAAHFYGHRWIYTEKIGDRRIYPLHFHQDFLGFELESLRLACFLPGGWHFNHCFFLFLSRQAALCQLTHPIPALTVTNDTGGAGFIYLSIGKIKEEEIKFF